MLKRFRILGIITQKLSFCRLFSALVQIFANFKLVALGMLYFVIFVVLLFKLNDLMSRNNDYTTYNLRLL